jgi:hypothetical protein
VRLGVRDSPYGVCIPCATSYACVSAICPVASTM